MCRTLNSLIPLVLLLSLGGHALAEDLNPPDFAGGDQTAVVFWGFNDDSDQPTSTTYDPAYIYNPELADPVFGFRYYNGAWQWQAGQGINGDGAMLLQDEESLVQPVPEGDGENITEYVQVTWQGPGSFGIGLEIWGGGEDWPGGVEFPDEYIEGEEGLDPIEEYDLGDGWTQSIFTATFPSEDVTFVHIICHLDVEGDYLIDQIVVDMVIHDGDEPPAGPGRVAGFQPELASNPIPADEERDVPRDVVLSWTPGVYADKHDVYFGTNFGDVNDATATVDPANVYQARQNPDHYPISGSLDLEWGQTYYWRIDEVNAPPSSTIYKGDVWSFTAEPFAYPIENITATASSYQEGSEPENTINGSGLDDDLHSTTGTHMWLTAKDGPQPTWIQYEFDKLYKLHEIWVWNHNTGFESYLGFGLRDVTVELSSNGTYWTQLGDVPEFAQAPGEAGYAHNTTIDLHAGPVAKYVKMTANSNWAGLPQYGLSEVRLLYLPVWARQPDPASGAADVGPDVTLSWRAGREAASHHVYLNTDEQAVVEGTAPATVVSEAGYDVGTLELGQTYYWRVDEVNDAEIPTTWQGDIWSFATREYVLIDDFEPYDDYCDRIFYTWTDGWGHSGDPDCGVQPYEGNGTGSTVGHVAAPFAERDIVHEGRQSMPFAYDNSKTPFYSEAERVFDTLQDWTKAGVKALTLYFHGDPDNSTAAPMYVALGDNLGHTASVPYDGDLSDMQQESWHEWNIDLKQFSNAGVSLTGVSKLYLGVGNRANPQMGGTGTLCIDDIRLYPSRCVPERGPVGDITNDCTVDCEDFGAMAKDWHVTYLALEYTFNADLSDTSGNKRHGIGQNGPSVHDGILTLDGTNWVDIPFGTDNPFDGSRDFSITMDFRTKVPSVLISSARDTEPDNHAMSVFIHHWDEPFWGEVIYDNFFVTAAAAEDDPLDGEWHTVVVTYDADGGWNDDLEQPTGWATVYLDGVPGDGTDMDPNIPNIAADTVRIGSSLNTTYPYEVGVGNLSGDIDNLRIYNFALTPEDVLGLPGAPGGPADLNKDGSVDFRDLAILASTWVEEIQWP